MQKNLEPDAQLNGLGDDGCVVVRVVACVEEVVVQRAVEPVVKELDWAGVEQHQQHRAVRPPQRQLLHAWHVHRAEEQQDGAQDDLVIPAMRHTHTDTSQIGRAHV